MDLMTSIREKYTDFVELCRAHKVEKHYFLYGINLKPFSIET